MQTTVKMNWIVTMYLLTLKTWGASFDDGYFNGCRSPGAESGVCMKFKGACINIATKESANSLARTTYDNVDPNNKIAQGPLPWWDRPGFAFDCGARIGLWSNNCLYYGGPPKDCQTPANSLSRCQTIPRASYAEFKKCLDLTNK